MKLSIVILNYNVRYFLETCIKSVQEAIKNIDAEIIVVDNASTDGSKEMMQQIFPDVKYIYLTENTGFPKGNNIGVEAAKGEFVCILNPDTIVAEDCFEKLLESYKTLPNAGIIGCHLIDGIGNFLPESKRGIPTPWVAFTKVVGLYRLFPNSKKFNQYYAQHIEEDEVAKVDILVGAFMLLKKDYYQQVGGFDEGCFMYADDIDLSYSITKQNKHNYYVPTTSVMHFKGESTLKDGLYMKRFKEAMQFFYTKHFKKSYFFNVLMNLGMVWFAFKKKNEQVNLKPKIQQYVLVSNDVNCIQAITKKNNNVLVVSNLKSFDLPTNTVIELLVDAEIVTYKDYIDFLKQNTNSNITFKIRPQKARFFIGSNDKNDKGEILSW